ncbi:MAG: polysaccharide biosynthesis C-terminal domain-containing protein [Bacteroidales bacterium]|nr:polysaccharide biosynthesis C-terminal domain-containing protein [Bacteroidales bacterium]
MQKKFLLNLFFLLFVNLLIKPFWIFGIDRVVQNMVGSEEYGFYFAILSFSLLFNFLLDIGLTNYNNRKVAYDFQFNEDYARDVFWLKFLLSLFYVVLVFVLAFSIGYTWKQMGLLFWVALNQILASFITFFRSFISGMQRFVVDSIFSVLDKALVILFMGLLLWTNWIPLEVSVYTFVYVQTFSLLLVFLAGFYFTYGHISISFHKISFARIKSYIKEGLPFALLALWMNLYTRIDAVMLERLLPGGEYSAGVYAMVFRILDAFNMFAALFGVILLPLLSRMIASHQDVREVLKSSTFILVSFAAFIWILSALWPSQAIDWLYHHDVSLASSLLPILMGDFFFVALIYIFGTYLTAAGRLYWLNIVTFAALVLNVLLNMWLIPHFDVLGAALASLSTQAFSALMMVWLSGKYARTYSFFKWIGIIVVFFGVMGLIGKELLLWGLNEIFVGISISVLSLAFEAAFFMYHLKAGRLLWSFIKERKI